MKKSFSIIFAGIIGMLVFTNQSYANPSTLPPSLDSTDVLSVSGDLVAIIDHSTNKADVVNVTTNKVVNLSNDAHTILDLNMMKNPQKIVLLKKSNGNEITKTVFTYAGEQISKTEIPLKDAADKIKWVAPTGKVNERIMVQFGDSFNLYQYPWTKPSVSFNAKINDNGYESVNVQGWDFVGYPYLAIKYQAQGIMSDDFFVRTINLFHHNEKMFKDFNADIKLKFIGPNLAVYTSYIYQPVPANAKRPVSDDPQNVFRLMNVATGSAPTSIKQAFKEEGDLSGWKTDFINNQVFVGDVLEQTWSLFSQEGTQILKEQKWPESGNSKFLSYDSSTKTAYFLKYSGGNIDVISNPIH
ncbi:hypothetical protein CA600_09530 [Paenibacillus sp. VTT E-133280]|uniref:hypothetical protein n=1 Tax=Paenibacillus sp. VTT E-133280 TaxID=1986222 RepID=UPI000BA07676|nr:hypothetical protein [Paenibacillus sp. VTT E-133280]OZQ67330.1 hypothetical protein CA600_09530 [Paenibacillus sp. VTT E-133280]